MGTVQSEECFSDQESVIPQERDDVDTEWELISHKEYDEKPFINKFSTQQNHQNENNDKLPPHDHLYNSDKPVLQGGGHFETVNELGMNLQITPIKEHTTR